MDTVLYSWLGAAAASPFVAILSCWTLVVFRSYRREWRLLDLFLFALTSLEVSSALFAFGFAVLSVIRPSLEAPCGFIVWGLTATRTFHLSAVTSLLLDRALSSKFPYTYRSSVSQSQVRYHIVVLAIISVFVGVTAVFARLPTPYQGVCSLHPSSWDIKFSVFLFSVYALLLLTGFVSCVVVQAGRMRSHGSYRTQGWESGTSSSAGGGSGGQLKTDFSEAKDLEWTVVACVCWLSYMANHGPFLVLTTIGLIVPTFWSPWLDNSIIWLRLVQGALVPLLLLVADLPHRSALRNMLRQPGRIYRHLSDHGGFRMQIGDHSCPKPGPLPPLLMFPGVYHQQGPFQLPQRLRWSPTTLPSLQALQSTTGQSTALVDSGSAHKNDYSTFDGYTPLDLRSSSSRMFSTPFSSFSSALGCSDDSLSITTDAVDDFVFHGNRGGRSPHPSVLTIFGGTSPEPNPQPVRRDTPIPFLGPVDLEAEDEEKFVCDSKKDTLEKKMIDIILAYENSPLSRGNRRLYDRSSFEKDSLGCPEDGDDSSGSDDADSVQSVIVRRTGVVSNERGPGDFSNCDLSADEKQYGQRVIYSEYL